MRGTLKLRYEECAADDALVTPLADVAAAADSAAEALEHMEGAAPDFARLAQRARGLSALTARFVGELPAGHVRWVDLTPHQAKLVESPLDIRAMLTEQRQRAPKTWVFTSATLGDDDAMGWFTRSTGLEDAVHLRVGSPFDYPQQARLWVPSRMPLPNDGAHPAAVGTLAARCAHKLGGRCFVLTTTLRVMPLIADALKAWLDRQGATLDVLVQGSEPRRTLLQRFGDGVGKVLVGSHSFWEGIDMPGDALQCVLIDKLPFPPPNDPLVEARVRQLKAEGRDPFDAYFVAEAAVALKQGAGRLIRTESDQGLLVLCDTRLATSRYGRRLLSALPPMGRIEGEEEAGAWLTTLASRGR